MEIKVLQNTMVITSTIKVDEVNYLAKANKEALVNKDEEGNELFRVAVGSKGSLSTCGVVFANQTATGCGTLTVQLPEDIKLDDRKEYVVLKYSAAFKAIKAFEESIPTAYSEAKETIESLSSDIEILG